MTTDQRTSSGQDKFLSALFQALAAVMTRANGSPWQIEMTPELSVHSGGSEEVLVNCLLDGGLRGEILLELRRDESRTLASAFLGEPVAQAGVEADSAVLSLINAWMRELSSLIENEFGMIKAQASIASEKQLNQVSVFQATIAGGGNRISISTCLNPALVASLNQHLSVENKGAASAAAKKSAEGNAVPEALNLNLVMDVELNVTLRFGQRKLSLREVLELTTGSVVELDRQVEEPVELLLDGMVIARGEAVVVDGNYGLRVTEVLQPVTAEVLQ